MLHSNQAWPDITLFLTRSLVDTRKSSTSHALVITYRQRGRLRVLGAMDAGNKDATITGVSKEDRQSESRSYSRRKRTGRRNMTLPTPPRIPVAIRPKAHSKVAQIPDVSPPSSVAKSIPFLGLDLSPSSKSPPPKIPTRRSRKRPPIDLSQLHPIERELEIDIITRDMEIRLTAVASCRWPQSFFNPRLAKLLGLKLVSLEESEIRCIVTPRGILRCTHAVTVAFRLPGIDSNRSRVVRLPVLSENDVLGGVPLIIGRPWIDSDPALEKLLLSNTERKTGNRSAEDENDTSMPPPDTGSGLPVVATESSTTSSSIVPPHEPPPASSSDSSPSALTPSTSDERESSVGGDDGDSISGVTDDSDPDPDSFVFGGPFDLRLSPVIHWLKDVIVKHINDRLAENGFQDNGSIVQHAAGGETARSAPPLSTSGCQSLDGASASIARAGTSAARGKRKVNDDHDDDEDDRKRRRDKSSKNSFKEIPRTFRRYACLYHKRYPDSNRIKDFGCLGLSKMGWTDVHRVKEHLFRRHKKPSLSLTCRRCQVSFPDDQKLDDHARGDPCLVKARANVPEEEYLMFDNTVEDELRRRPRNMSEEQRWVRLFTILFNDVPQERIPSPYFDIDVCGLLRKVGTVERCSELLAECLEPPVTSDVQRLFDTQPPSPRTQTEISDVIRSAIRSALQGFLPGLLTTTTRPPQDFSHSTLAAPIGRPISIDETTPATDLPGEGDGASAQNNQLLLIDSASSSLDPSSWFMVPTTEIQFYDPQTLESPNTLLDQIKDLDGPEAAFGNFTSNHQGVGQSSEVAPHPEPDQLYLTAPRCVVPESSIHDGYGHDQSQLGMANDELSFPDIDDISTVPDGAEFPDYLQSAGLPEGDASGGAEGSGTNWEGDEELDLPP